MTEYLTIRDIATEMDCSQREVRRLTSDDEIISIQVFHYLRVHVPFGELDRSIRKAEKNLASKKPKAVTSKSAAAIEKVGRLGSTRQLRKDARLKTAYIRVNDADLEYFTIGQPQHLKR
jgi:hypothetical protein